MTSTSLSIASSSAVLLQPVPIALCDLQQFAEFLAAEFEHDERAAALAPATWYQEQIGVDVCRFADAMQLRTRTIRRCGEITEMRLSVAGTSQFTLRDFARGDVADRPANRAMRNALISALPGRIQCGVVDVEPQYEPDPVETFTPAMPAEIRSSMFHDGRRALLGDNPVNRMPRPERRLSVWMARCEVRVRAMVDGFLDAPLIRLRTRFAALCCFVLVGTIVVILALA